MRLRVIDIETTGGSPSEIIEIASVDVVSSGPHWTVEAPRSQLFRPLGPITFHAMAIHHLTPDDFGDDVAASSAAALREFAMAGSRPDYLVAHNAQFERQHIPDSVTDGLEWICTVKGARQAWPEAPGYSNQVLRYWRGLRLDPARSMPPHRAGPDAWVTAHLLIELLQTATAEELSGWMTMPRPLGRVPFGRYRGQDWNAPPDDYLLWLAAEPDMAKDVRAKARAVLAGRAALTPGQRDEGGYAR